MLGAMNALAAQQPRPQLVVDNDRRLEPRAEKREHPT